MMVDTTYREILRTRLGLGFYDKEFMSGLLELIDSLWAESEEAAEILKKNESLENKVAELESSRREEKGDAFDEGHANAVKLLGYANVEKLTVENRTLTEWLRVMSWKFPVEDQSPIVLRVRKFLKESEDSHE